MQRITPDTVFLVSGGARGITARCVIRLAQHYHCKFILVGRSAFAGQEPAYALGCRAEAELKKRITVQLGVQGHKPTPLAVQKTYDAIIAYREIAQTLHEIAQAGGQADYLSVDITNALQLQTAVAEAEQRLGPITAILHGAGNLADKLIERKTEQDFEQVYAVKVEGLQNLLQCVEPAQLDYLVLFSSAAGFYGNVGQTDYALANEVLNKAAHHLQRLHPHWRVHVFDWGPWEGGMVTPALQTLFEARHIHMIPIEAGSQVLVDTLESATGTQLLVGSSWVTHRPALDSELRIYSLRRWLTLDQNPFLRDHVINRHAVLPMAVALAWLANAAEQLYPGYKFCNCQDFKTFKGIVFDDSLASAHILEMKETTKSEGELVLQTMLSSKTQDKLYYHYGASLTLRDRKLPMPAWKPTYGNETGMIEGKVLYQDGTLFHGPRFQTVRQVLHLDRNGLRLRCELPQVTEHDQGQFPMQAFNYFMLDTAFQSLVIWARSSGLAAGLPLSCRQGFHFSDVRPGDVFYVSAMVVTGEATRLVADVFIHDEQGRCYFQLSDAELTLSESLNEMFRLNQLDVD